MQSKKRKTQASASANPQKTPIFKLWWFWLIIALVVGCLCLILLKDTITKPDTGATGSTETYPETQLHTCNVGETFDANGMHITYLGVEKWLPEGETAHPKEGYTFIRLKIAAENKATEDREIYDNEFSCYADGIKETFEFFKQERLKGGILAPGQRDEGYIYFSVPVDASSIEVTYRSYLYWRYNVATLPVKLPE